MSNSIQYFSFVLIQAKVRGIHSIYFSKTEAVESTQFLSSDAAALVFTLRRYVKETGPGKCLSGIQIEMEEFSSC